MYFISRGLRGYRLWVRHPIDSEWVAKANLASLCAYLHFGSGSRPGPQKEKDPRRRVLLVRLPVPFSGMAWGIARRISEGDERK
jgi:hypothetical protein